MSVALLTFHDAYETLIDSFAGGNKASREVRRNARRAVMEALYSLPARHHWRYFRRQTMVTTDATYSTGTVEYTLATRRLTLTGGTWPAEAQYGAVIIDEVRYIITRRISDTVVELDQNQSPAADIAAGTTYRWHRYRYLLPHDVGRIISVVDALHFRTLVQKSTDFIFQQSEVIRSESYPTSFNMVRSPDFPGRWELWVASASSAARPLRILYEARFVQAIIDEESAGTVTITANEDTATFSNAIATDDFVGCVLRTGRNDKKPTARVGGIGEVNGDDLVLPTSERVITAVNSTTEVVLSAPVTSTVTAQKFTVSTHIDVNPSGMLAFFHRLVQYHYHLIRQSPAQETLLATQSLIEAQKTAQTADAAIPQEPTDYRIRRRFVSPEA
jgi:hypothetical protein